jgi:hypothetical protein
MTNIVHKNLEQIAMKLTGLDVGSQFEVLANEAKEMGIAFAFCSGNTLEVKGVLEQTLPLQGTSQIVCFHFEGKNYIIDTIDLGDYDDGDEYEHAAHKGLKRGMILDVISRPVDTLDLDWLIEPRFIFEAFIIMSQGKPYCRGAVFTLENNT